ncbi:hypothetical protein Rhopal_001562-T1 [Rhodotorula paludigena]|uniref:Adenylyl cyclase-associated protein n=1 Tax=Rhodotorula paludigena TaxID=86838 RepID=A0AAV5G7Q3_9BASI|nr:hypothetical protein Rhopal_001562-T1 [Rhodotorula paludigena]
MASSGVAGVPAAGVGSLNALLKRLEAACSRLEDVALTHASSGGVPSSASAVSGAHLAAPVAAPAPPPKGAEQLAPAVQAFQDLVDGPLTAYVDLSKELGGLIAEQAQQVANGFLAQKDFVQLASACTKVSASDPKYQQLIAPTQQALLAVIDVKEKNRASKESNQLSVVSEGIPALGWVTLESKPGPYVGEFKDSATFWVNRVIKEHKDSNPKQVEWARSFVALLEELRKYVMEWHTTGLTWNPKGADASTYKPATSSASAAPAGPSGGAPPPPPPPPPPPAAPAPPPPPPAGGAAAASSSSSGGGDMSAVFSQLNRGEDVTKGLRKVDQSEMTHKNPELRAAKGPAPAKAPKPAGMGQQQQQQAAKKPPKKELDGNKWNIENYEGEQQIVVDQTEINQTINIFNVKSSIIQVKGKVNAISLVNCPKTSILLDSTVSSLSVSNSPSFTVQILGKVPTVLLDGNDGGQVYLSRASLDCEIVSAKCSALNVSLPVDGEEDGIFEEKAVPEQFKTVVKDGKLVTTVVEHSG